MTPRKDEVWAYNRSGKLAVIVSTKGERVEVETAHYWSKEVYGNITVRFTYNRARFDEEFFYVGDF